ncbi:MAG: glycosyltransferase [Phycisphaerae bacterium]|jgi:glycosyltransferase involved in cell wall biosynthesis
MRPLRICQLITELGPAGAERCVFELARRLDKRRFEVQVAALRGGAVAQWLTEASVPVTVLDIRSRLDLPKAGKLVAFLARERFDILHTHLFHADLVGRPAAWLTDVPHLVHTVHTAEGRYRPWQFAYARLAAPLCERIICVSASARDLHARRSGLPLSHYTVIPNGVDAAAFSRDPQARAELRKQWGLGEREVLAAYVGRLDGEKGIDTLLEAWSGLIAGSSVTRLIIAGDGPRRSRVENVAVHGRGRWRIKYLGFVRDVRGLLSAADMLVMPSMWEGFGLTAAEAMAAGLPVIATDVPGLRDVIDDGVTGVLVPREDAVALASTVAALAADGDKRHRMGQAGLERVKKLYPLDASIAAHERLYEAITDPRNDQSRSRCARG